MSKKPIITPEVAAQAAQLSNIFDYNPLFINGTAEGELITAVNNTVHGLKPFFSETDPKSLEKVAERIEAGELIASLVEGEHEHEYSIVIADHVDSFSDDLIEKLTANLELVKGLGRMVAVVKPYNKTTESKLEKWLNENNGWLEVCTSDDTLGYACVNKKAAE